MKLIATLLGLSVAVTALAQDKPAPLQFSGYVETYYAYDFSRPENGERPDFLYNYDQHNEFNINLAYLKAAYTGGQIRSNLAIMAGTYAQANLILEPELARYVFEANAGVKLAKNKNLWLDVGIMPSHIGFESAIGKDCWTLTRSIIAENSPYYESGAKLTYTSDNDKWQLSGLLLNGWQRIGRTNRSNRPDFGSQLLYKPSDKFTVNWSTYIGKESYTTALLNRYFNNLYIQSQLNRKWGLTFGFDFGAQERSQDNSALDYWWSRVLIVRYAPGEHFRMAFRLEDYVDPNNVILNLTNSEFRMRGASVNFDFIKFKYAMLRIEPRYLFSPNNIFINDNKLVRNNLALTMSLSVGF